MTKITYSIFIHALTIIQTHFLFTSSYHFDKCELAKELVNKHGVPPSQINDCKCDKILTIHNGQEFERD